MIMLLAAEAATNKLTERITNVGLLLSLLCFLLGAVALAVELGFFKRQVDKAKGPNGTLTEHGAVTGAIDSVTKLATALKDLKPSGQLFVLSMAFLAIAAVAAGLDAVAGGIAK